MVKIKLSVLLLIVSLLVHAQPLTVEKIMRDPKWIGTQPSDPVWSPDNKYLYFKWNPEKNISDSDYRYSMLTGQIEKAGYRDGELIRAMKNGKYNDAYTRLVYAYKGDIYLLDVKTNTTRRITQTAQSESDPAFIRNDQWICYQADENLYAWNITSGATEQLTNFSHTPAAAAINKTAKDSNSSKQHAQEPVINQQEKWLKEDQLNTSAVVKERKEKEDAKKAFLAKVANPDSLRIIHIGDKQLQNVNISPDGRFVTYRLYAAPTPSRRTIVPNYVTESGFTTDITGRTKVGNNQGTTSFYVYDLQQDTVIKVETNAIRGITEMPGFRKDYPNKFVDTNPTPREVTIYGPYWNESGTRAFVDIRSQDFKDRWLMELTAATGKLSLIDRQHNEAWIDGPGISDDGTEAKQGWLNEHTIYYQGEATGYSHLYSYDVNTSTAMQLTKGNYEVQDLVLPASKKYFYLLTNETHPGKQNWYRINTDGTGKEMITSMTGGYEVVMSPGGKYIAYRYSYINQPWELYVQENLPGKKPVQVTHKSMSDEFKSYAWRVPEMVQIPARDGATIYGRLYEPEPSKKNGAAVIFVHGAGYLQNGHYWWSQYFREYMFHNLLADRGYTVIDVDYRASKGYGRDWRTGIYRYMGGKDLDDNIDAINWMIKNRGIDPNRVGMYGGSYGGFITLMTLFTKPDVVKAGAALRPVTDWAHYNHGYTARILNEPFTDSLAYARSSPINFAEGLKNHLLICHGMLDVNVNFQDVVRLTQRLIELGKDDWQIAPYPLEDHAFVEASSWTDEYKRILKLFNENLLK